MNVRALVVLFLVLSLALLPVLLAAPVRAQGPYTERLDVYTAGQDAYWRMTFGGLNASVPSLSSAESGASGVTGYALTALSMQGEVSNYQVFGPNGYNILGLPYYPTQGLFLTINASSASAGSSLLSYFGSKFGTTFSQVSNSGGVTTYFAPVDFGGIAAPALLKLVPTGEGGFSTFVTEATFLGLPMPSVRLTGTYNGTGFDHSMTVGAATASLLGSGNTVNLSEIIGSTNATLSASAKSSSSQVVIHSLDGLVISGDKAASISNDLGSLSGTYTLPVAAGGTVRVNASLQSAPVAALAYRILDHGSLSNGDKLSVTVSVANTATAGTLQNVFVNDSWWQSYPSVFQLSNGNYSFTIPSIAAGKSVNESYVLTVVSGSSQQIVIPSTPVTYSYLLSSRTYNDTIGLGENVVQVNNVGPAISVVAQSTISSGKALGSTGNYTVTVTNNGNSPAFNLKMDGQTASSLAQNGGTYVFSVPIALISLSQTNLSRSFSLQYSNSAGQTQNITTNSVRLVLSHNAMVIPFVTVTTSDALTASALSSGLMNVTYDFTNSGKGVSSGVLATEALPTGVSCKVATGLGGTCSGTTLTIAIPSLNATSYTTTVQLNFTRDNLVIPATAISSAYQGLKLSTYGGAYAIPAGISVTKTYTPSFGFPGSKSSVTVTVSNVGAVAVYNATVTSSADAFDSGPTGTTEQTYPTIAPQQSSSFNYTVTLSSSPLGNQTSSPVSMSFIFAGSTQDLSLGATRFVLLSPVAVYATSTPAAPEENHDFALTLVIANPSDVTVSNVVYTLNLPSEVSVTSGGTVTNHELAITIPSLAPNSNSTVALKMNAGTDLTLNTGDSHLTFQYQGTTLAGTLPTLKVAVAVDVTTRYTLPIIIAIFVALAAVVYVRRRVSAVATP